MTIYKKTEKFAIIALCVSGAAFSVILGGALAQPALGGYALAMFSGVALLPALLTVFHATMKRLAQQEQDAMDQVADDSIFAGDQAESQIKRRNLHQFEAWMLPVAVGIIGLVELVSGLYLLKLRGQLNAPGTEMISAQAGGAAVLAATLFLMGSYLSGLAFRGSQPMLRGIAAELSTLAWLCGAFAVFTVGRLARLQTDIDALFGAILGGILLARAAERGISVVMEIYRPRKIKDGTSGLLYESKFSVVLADPRGVLGGLSDALHYQFGIRISEDGLLKLGVLGIPAVVMLNLVFLMAFSCIVVINPGERAVIERFGRRLPGMPVLGPGLHVKRPWPIDLVYRRNIQEIKSVTIGTTQTDAPRALWTQGGGAGFDLFLTPADRMSGDAESTSLNLLAMELFIHYRISSVSDYIYNCRDPEAMLKALSRRQLTAEVAGKPFFGIILDQREALCKNLQDGLQAVIDNRKLGISIVDVGLNYLQPPPPIVVPYQDVVASEERREIDVISAQREFNDLVTQVKTDKKSLISEAQAFRDQRISMARAEAESYTRLLPLYKKYGQLMKARMYFDMVEQAVDRRKIVIATETDDQLIRLDLKKTKSELFEFTEETGQ